MMMQRTTSWVMMLGVYVRSKPSRRIRIYKQQWASEVTNTNIK
jgi:hypothetical protein